MPEFGPYGGQFVEKEVLAAIKQVEKAYLFYKNDLNFWKEYEDLLKNYANRPSMLYYAKKMSEDLGGAKIYLKREDLNHTGSHKINNVIGQALLAKKMGKTHIIAETGAGQHGVATATICALMDLKCTIYMGEEDINRQALNVYRMKLLNAKVVAVTSGTKTLKDAVDVALLNFANDLENSFYLIGSAVGPHPYPMMVRDFQKVISAEIKEQMLASVGRLPDAVIACVGGGSNAIGSFYHFIENQFVQLYGAEASGKGVDTPFHAASITKGKVGLLHGMKSYFIQDEKGEVAPVYSISAGLDYPGIGPEHAYLFDQKRASYLPVSDAQAIEAFEYLSRLEGIIPAIESAHALYLTMQLAKKMGKDKIIVCTLSGRGDKDCEQIAKVQGYIF